MVSCIIYSINSLSPTVMLGCLCLTGLMCPVTDQLPVELKLCVPPLSWCVVVLCWSDKPIEDNKPPERWCGHINMLSWSSQRAGSIRLSDDLEVGRSYSEGRERWSSLWTPNASECFSLWLDKCILILIPGDTGQVSVNILYLEMSAWSNRSHNLLGIQD